MKANDTVEFINPNEGENDMPMIVLELRGDRVLVEHQIENMRIKPTGVYLISDLKVVT